MQHSNIQSCPWKIFTCAAIALFIFILAEFIARLDDKLFLGENFFSNPNFDKNLKYNDNKGTRGKPFGNFRKCKLNGYGFRGPEIDPLPPHAKTRIMVIGASEAFGSCDLDNTEFPAQLQSYLGNHGKYEVVNAAIVGMGLWSTLSYWENWASRFRPDIVIVYANPLFYLRSDPFTQIHPGTARPVVIVKPIEFESRLLFRLHGLVHYPDWVNIWRKKKSLAELRKGKLKSWYFPLLPQDRYNAFCEDYFRLADTIRKQNVKVILATHAIKTTIVYTSDDELAFLGMLNFYPKASAEGLINFNLETNRMILEYAQKQGFSVIDAAKKLNGHRELFDDFVHLNKEGSGIMARMISEYIVKTNVAKK